MNQEREITVSASDSPAIEMPAQPEAGFEAATQPLGVSLRTMLTCWWRPATTAHEFSGVKLRHAYLIHLAAGMAILLIVLLLAEMDQSLSGYGGPSIIADILEEFGRYPEEMLLGTIAGFGSIEAGFLALALAVLPIGAGDERLRSSWAHALRHVWLHTTHGVPLVFTMGVLMITQWDIIGDRSSEGNARLVWLGIVGSVWFLWSVFRAVGARRSLLPIARPPMCEVCGYNLSVTPMNSLCPECGTPVIESLGAGARPGPAFERGVPGSWGRCGVGALFSPRRLARHIQLTTQPRRYRQCLILPLITAFLAVAIGLICAFIIDTGQNPWEHETFIVTAAAPLAGAISATGLLCAALAIAAVAGMIQTLIHKRNLLPAAAQVISYLYLFLSAWGLYGGASIILVFIGLKYEFFRAWSDRSYLGIELLVFTCLILPHFLWAAACFVLVWKRILPTRYANK